MPQSSIPQSDKLAPTALVIFGVTGNLAGHKLLPALYELIRYNHVPDKFKIIAVFRDSEMDIDKLVQQTEINLLRTQHEADKAVLQKLKSIITPIQMDSTNVGDYIRLKTMLDMMDASEQVSHNRLFYLAIPPDIFKTVVGCLAEVDLNKETEQRASRILVEKPFGTNLASAQDLVKHLSERFGEKQIYRIDHYLAKETAQNILAFRFNNPLIEDMWGRQFIDHIQITASEMIGIEGRASFYEGMGAMRDLVQSHMLQLMALIMMEAPEELTSEGIHAEKLALLSSVRPIKTNHVEEIAVRGQYEGYLTEVQNPNSKIETFAALCLEVTNSRWGGVPVLLRTGKSLSSRLTEINVIFKDRSRRSVPENILTIRIQPNEGISLKLTAKKPGFSNEIQPVNMDFSYQSTFEDENPDAYERVLVDAIAGDQSLFATSEEVIKCWEIIEPILQIWEYYPVQPDVYAQGTWGPTVSDELAKSFGSTWIDR